MPPLIDFRREPNQPIMMVKFSFAFDSATATGYKRQPSFFEDFHDQLNKITKTLFLIEQSFTVSGRAAGTNYCDLKCRFRGNGRTTRDM
jgi:hypothetical protein